MCMWVNVLVCIYAHIWQQLTMPNNQLGLSMSKCIQRYFKYIYIYIHVHVFG